MRTMYKAAATSASMIHISTSAFAIAQFIKFFTTWYKEKRWDLKQLVGSGGMPSSHSATVTALAASIGFQEGLGGPLFATALILACIVMYDATGVRLQAGRQAEVLNQIVYELPAEHPLAESRPLRELLGHTPLQVIVGGLLGIITAAMGHLIAMVTA
ncbi:Acid phosphatase/vanadium-dependent haloperoxidase-related protein [Quillaja saponaria]|uniref:Acid phosphatase/vanadium-dependent haloperoxidase-related protein n=1 Tax=Quillaja saponaria TaxID=32244 RepID=A0AAD7PK09_QUISA|nr:Acid phosphatase/vanadium-dependent haloperoxidase-related protein [Quillaja saponaria]